MRPRPTTHRAPRRRTSAAVLAAGLALAAATAAAPAEPPADRSAPETAPLGSLSRGDAIFWQTEHIDAAGTDLARQGDTVTCHAAQPHFQPCFAWADGELARPQWVVDEQAAALGETPPSCETDTRCWRWTINLPEAGEELRLMFDRQSDRDIAALYVHDPTGELHSVVYPRRELRVQDPLKGTWTLLLQAQDVRDARIRLRASLDPAPTAYDPDTGRPAHPGGDRPAGAGRGHDHGTAEHEIEGALLPNLRLLPPHDLGFHDCKPSEQVDFGARRCLRFSTGPENVGDGPLDLRILEYGEVTGRTWQRIHREVGEPVLVPVGTFEWHAEHAHYHHQGIADPTLHHVDPAIRTMTPVATGPKQGFCMGPYLLGDWFSFDQAPAFDIYDSEETCDAGGAGRPTQIALARGWADIYPWFIEGQFVDFAGQPDGQYVITAVTDPDDHVLETDDTDNTSYVHFEVRGDEIHVIEKGYGTGPFDPHRAPETWRRGTVWRDDDRAVQEAT